MTHKLVITDRVFEQLDSGYVWYQQNVPQVAAAWFNGWIDALNDLCQEPERYPLAHESPLFPFPIHQLLYGVGKKKSHRALFVIRSRAVVVLTIRHLSQQDFTPEEMLEESPP